MVFRAPDWNRRAKRVATADDEAELDLVIKARARSKYWLVAGFRLSAGPLHRRARNDNRVRTAVIPYRHPFVVRQQRIVRADELPDARGMVDAGVEISVVAD